MNQKTKQKEKSREAITTSVATLLRQRGIKASSVMDVMKGAGSHGWRFLQPFRLEGGTLRRGASERGKRELGAPLEIRAG